MTRNTLCAISILALSGTAACQAQAQDTTTADVQIPVTSHPNTSGPEWEPLFADDLSDAIDRAGVWSWEGDSLLTATEDEAIFTKEEYDDYVLDLEVKFEPHANSGIIVHASDTDNWIPNSLEIQIGDSYGPGDTTALKITEAGSMFGHVAPSKQMIKPPGEWNRFTVTAHNDSIWLVLNGEFVSEIDMSEYTSAETNPDGTKIPGHLSTPLAELPTEGHIGLQGKHGQSTVWFRNIKIRKLD